MKSIRKIIFGEIYVINRDADVQRMMKISKRLAEINITFRRFSAKCFISKGNHKSAGMRGLNASHLAIVAEAKNRNFESVLIIEDDAIFRPNFIELWEKIQSELIDLKYDIFYGYNWANCGNNAKDIKITRIQHTLCTHFWAIRACFYEKFIAITESNETINLSRAIDQLFTSTVARIYAPTYNLVGQDAGISTVTEGSHLGVRWHYGRGL